MIYWVDLIKFGLKLQLICKFGSSKYALCLVEIITSFV